jgi:hypothetical protein
MEGSSVAYLDSIDLADLQAHLGDAERRERPPNT